MNSTRFDGYLALAVCVATASIVSTTTQMFQIIRDFDSSASENLSFVAFGLSQASLATAMMCAVIIGRNMVATRRTKSAPSDATTPLQPDGHVESA